MYVEIKENKLLSWCENPYLDYQYVDIDYSAFDVEKYVVTEGVLTDISDTEEYKAKTALAEKATKTAQITLQIDEIDQKRIRAIAEPQLKDAVTGQTWLEYYTQQISALRSQIAAL